jgi:hypothetical protein
MGEKRKAPSKPPKTYRVQGPSHMSPRTGGGICGILTVAMLSVPALISYGIYETIGALI